MEIDITYIAKDGCRFKDPLKCEDYEKTIGVLPNSVADVINMFEKYPKHFIFGIVMVKHKDGTCSIYTRFTGCCDRVLEDYVTVSSIAKEQRYIYATFEELIATLRDNEDKDSPAQYMIVYDNDMEFKHPGVMASHNPLVWKQVEVK